MNRRTHPIQITLLATASGLQALTDMQQPQRGAALTPEESAALGMLNLARGCGVQVVYGNNPMGRLVNDLLDPECFGHAVCAEIRDRAREAKGNEPVETRKARA